jgi:EmrB/QacA subfamily drug resistance transporter
MRGQSPATKKENQPLFQALTNSANRKWVVFGTLAIGTFMSVVSHGSAIVAVPTIAAYFQTDLPTVQWVIIGETLTIAVLLLPMGRLGDMVGRKPVYIVGFFFFVGASALAGAAWWGSLTMLVFAKVLQGVGSAMIQGNSVAMVVSTFPENERGKALGSNLSVVGFGAIIGPALGGLLISLWGWLAVFLVNVPVGIITIVAAAFILGPAQSGGESRGRSGFRFDWLGAALCGGALLLFMLIVGNGYTLGWGSAYILTGSATFAVLLATFIWWELRNSAPMLELRLFKSKVLALGVVAGWISFLGTSATRFIMPFYLQRVLGLSPGQVGLLLIPPALCMVIFGPLSGRWSDKFGWRNIGVVGLACSSSATLVFALMLTESSPLFLIVALLVLQSAGTGLFNSPNNSSMLSVVERTSYGVVSSLTQLIRNSANVTSIAVATTVVVVTMGSLGVEPSLDAVSPRVADAFLSGLHRSFLIMGGILLVGVLVSVLRDNRAPQRAAPPQWAPRAEPVAEASDD